LRTPATRLLILLLALPGCRGLEPYPVPAHDTESEIAAETEAHAEAEAEMAPDAEAEMAEMAEMAPDAAAEPESEAEAPAGNSSWSRGFGGQRHDQGSSIAVDHEGNVLVAGHFSSASIDFDGDELTNASDDNDIFVIKLDAAGELLWSRTFGGTGDDRCHALAVDREGKVTLAGYFVSPSIDLGGGVLVNQGRGGDAFVLALDADGSHRWSRRFGVEDWDRAEDLAVDGDGNLFFTGSSYSAGIDFGGGSHDSPDPVYADIFLVKLDAEGGHLWSRVYAGTDNDFAHALALDRDGNIFITGNHWSSDLDFGGGSISKAGSRNFDMFLAKLDPQGGHRWSRAFGGGDREFGKSLAVDHRNNILVTGWFGSPGIDFGGGIIENVRGRDAFLVAFDPQGEHLWSRGFTGDGFDDQGFSVAVGANGRVLLTGAFVEGYESNIDFGGGPLACGGGSDAFLAVFEGNGAHAWSRSFGGENAEIGFDVATGAGGFLYLTGSHCSPDVEFVGETLDNHGFADIFVVKLDQPH